MEKKQLKKHVHKGKFFMVLMKCKCGTIGYPIPEDEAKKLKLVSDPLIH